MAIAPERVQRIGIQRHFTTPGQHPYDTLEWETREARIPDLKSGGDAFYQPDVEFPKSWSQNATNIVAQKYFRGPLGAPEREYSVRQIIDRVADTITEWGVRDGYFADSEESETFRAELKYVLVHQRAAFNSPVWFNIGVHGEPQQASACFILEVDDTMDSILNWYREEGIIFKGGSGSGINLSKIRSSKEPLKGGGTASGPVSFMRGADSSAGTIKCLHEDTPIVTERGVVPIRDVRASDSVLTRFGLSALDGVHDNGVRPLVRVRTSLGDEILCTPEHRFWIRGADGEGWREAGELRSDDYLRLDVSAQPYGRLQGLRRPTEGHHREIAHDLPEVLDESFALWLGWLWGDGSITSDRNAKFIAMQIGDADEELSERYRELTRGVFGERIHFYESRHTDKADASTSVRFSSGQIIRFLGDNGLRKTGAAVAAIPTLVASSPPAVRAAFLSGLFEADGHLGNGYPILSTVSHQLAIGVHRLLMSLGIPSAIGRIEDRIGAHGDRTVFTVRVVGGEGVLRFAKLVGFVSQRKQAALEAAVARKSASPYETQWFLPHVDSVLSEIWEITDDPALWRALSPYSRSATPRGMSLLRARALVEKYPHALSVTRLADFAFGEDLYVSATVEPAGEGHVFDLTVAEVHEYLINGMITHNSGGKTRRAAKMVILNADHPDVEEFIWCKALEERKARALGEAGFDMDLDGKDAHSIQYQNANNSVRVTDEFMRAVEEDADWELRAVTDGETVRTVKARDLMRQIAEAAWECADPGMQYDTTINRWHTAANTGRINASNPCFTGDTHVHTDKGLIRFDELVARAQRGETFGIYTHDATNPDEPAERVEITRPEAFMVTGWNEIVRLRFSHGAEVRCTPNHRFFTVNRGYVRADELTADDEVKVLTLPAPAVAADLAVPKSATLMALAAKGDKKSLGFRLPEKWTPELAHYLGWLVGDGCISGDVVSTVYGTGEEQEHILPAHRSLIAWMNDDREPTPSVQPNGTVQLRQSRRALRRFFDGLGVTSKKAGDKVVPRAIEQAPPEIAAAFLRGLFDADGCVYDGKTSRYVGLGSASGDLLRGVQRLLTSFGVFSRIYPTRKAGDAHFTYVRKDGSEARYEAGALYDLRIANRSIVRFADEIGFEVPSKAEKLERLLANHDFYTTNETVRLKHRADDGVDLTFNLAESRNHSYIANGQIVANCSEYMHLDNSACNLASINLLKYLDEGAEFDVEGFKHTVQVVFTAQEILVGNADYPTERIGDTARKFRQLGLGYANLGALLMARGLPYDSSEGRAWAAALTALMTGDAYATSARMASRMGPFAGYVENREPMARVLNQHRSACAEIDEELVPADLLDAARQSWDEACELGEQFGVRNSQSTVLAPTGTIGLMMDCDTTGVEPDLALTKHKKLVGGGTMEIVNRTVPRALRALGYDDVQVDEIVAHVDEQKTIVGAPDLQADHLPVFATAMGDNVIHYMGHVRMMAAVQPFISGAISKTVNVPEEATVDEVGDLYLESWRLGLKAVAIYRDNCKVGQPLATQKKAAVPLEPERVVETVIIQQPVRQRLPKTRTSKTFSFRVADCKGYCTVGEFEDGRPGEIFLKVAKQGSTLAGIMDSFAIAMSLGLQYGVPLRAFVEKYTSTRFEPAGMTDDKDIRFASSLVDYIFRRLAVEYMPYEERAELGIFTVKERTQPTLPGVEEAATPSRPEFRHPELDFEPARDDEEPFVYDADVPPSPSEQPPAPLTRMFIDAPLCTGCGAQMRPSGSCYVCTGCGSTSGCS